MKLCPSSIKWKYFQKQLCLYPVIKNNHCLCKQYVFYCFASFSLICKDSSHNFKSTNSSKKLFLPHYKTERNSSQSVTNCHMELSTNINWRYTDFKFFKGKNLSVYFLMCLALPFKYTFTECKRVALQKLYSTETGVL